MDLRGYQQYRAQSLSTMTAGELLVMLYDELITRLTRAELALKAENYEAFDQAITRCKDIVRYLDDTLDRQYPISAELTRLYDYFLYSLSRVQSGRNAQVLEEIKPMLTELRDSFHTAQRNNNV